MSTWNDAISISLGASKAGILASLRAQRFNLSTGSSIGGVISSGFTEQGLGAYTLYLSFDSTNGSQQGVVVYDVGGTFIFSSSSSAPVDANSVLSGPSSVTLSWEDSSHVAVPSVDFAIVGVGSGRADVDGSSSFGLSDGTYTVVSRTTSLVSFPSTTLVVDGDTTQTITGNALVAPTSAGADICSASLLVLDVNGDPANGVVFSFKMTSGPGDDGTSYSTEIGTATSGVDGIVTLPLIRGGVYDVKREDGGDWLRLRAADAATMTLPEILGQAGIS